MKAIRTRHLRKEAVSGSDKLQVLKGVDLDIEAREIVAIMGPSGSGKSTLLALLGGLDRPTAGDVLIGEDTISAMSERQLVRWRRTNLGFIFQSYMLVRSLTAVENVALPLHLTGAPDAVARAQEQLHAVGMGDRLNHYPHQLSGGEQQRVAVVRAFAAHPPVILADEPTGNLDSRTGTEVLGLMIQQARAAGSTLVIVTHDPAVASRCDRTIFVRDGLVLREGEQGSAD